MRNFFSIFAVMCLLASVNAGLIVNGSFEEPVVSGNFETPTAIPDWEIIQSINLISELWVSSDGEQSIDLNDSSQGKIAQQITTVVGETYVVTFDMAANTALAPVVKTLTLGIADTADGAYVDSEGFSFDSTGFSNTNMGWEPMQWEFTATNTATWIVFESTSSGACGPALDNVDVNLVPEPATMLLLGIGGLVLRKRS